MSSIIVTLLEYFHKNILKILVDSKTARHSIKIMLVRNSVHIRQASDPNNSNKFHAINISIPGNNRWCSAKLYRRFDCRLESLVLLTAVRAS